VRKRFSTKLLLTLREREVLRWLARGKTNAEIGAILGISAATVSKHLEHIYPKLGVENRTAAASFASELLKYDD
jgi:DNA-binding CsgD family transcriptional regulator